MRRCFQICCKRGIPLQEDIGNIPKYVPEINQGRVIKVYDGDTITVAGYVKNNPQLFKFSVRLHGIDCPEIKSKKSNDKSESLCIS